ncbi:hypothetical protein GCM10025789_12840 [Tessaracoccus lubricantis]|uniref:Uncharacterized protein n=1 Tax=Tessaracoccus lubricantis TaxID=545543 RepID=A0ABP9F9K8_9ACTN
MRSPQLHAVGFDFKNMDALTKAAFDGGVRGVNKAPGFALIGAYSDPSGARLAFLQRKGQAVNVSAGLRSEATYRAQVIRFTDLLARVAVYSPGEDGGLLAQFLAMVDDPIAYEQHELGPGGGFSIIQALQVGALAMDVEVFADEAAFQASDAARVGAMLMEPRSMVSPSLMGLQAASITIEEATPTLLMAAVVEAVEVRRNELSGVDFQYVRASSIIDLTLAVPMEHPVEPGNVVHGTFYATANAGTWDRNAG